MKWLLERRRVANAGLCSHRREISLA